MTAEDMLATWTTDFAVHHLDLIPELSGRPGPLPEAVSVTVQTLDGLLGSERPGWWDDLTYPRKGTGRLALDEADRAFLGEWTARYPAFR